MIKFSYHRVCRGKPEKRFDGGRLSLWMGDQRVNLGYGWITAELEFEELFEMLTQDGITLGPALSSDHRQEDNFVSHQIALVDIDSGMTLEELQQHPFYRIFGSGYYTTPSYTDGAPKFRIIYRLQDPITDAEEMREIYEGLLAIHGYADISCKDPARLFFGTIGAQHREITDRFVDDVGLQVIRLARQQAQQERQRLQPEIRDDREYSEITREQVEELLDELRRHYPDLNYAQRRDVTWAVKSAIGGQAARSVMRARWDDSDKNGKYEDMIAAPTRNEITLGTVYHMIRQHDPDYRRSREQSSQRRLDDSLEKIKERIAKWRK
jgi:hypothetical protein